MKFLSLAVALGAALVLRAAVPAPPQLFPQDTLLLLTVPDWTASRASLGAGPFGQLWADPLMKPFRDKFEVQFREKFLAPLEKDLGVKPEEYQPLLQGQVSFAAIKAAWNPADEETDPTLVVVIDARDKADQLKLRLTEARQKLTDAKKTVRIDKIRDVEFTTVVLDPKDMKKPEAAKGAANPDPDADPDDADAKPDGEPKKLELTFGQVDSALVIATSTAGLERVVARLTGGTLPTIGETPEFQGAETASGFREAAAYGFVQTAALVEALQSESATAGSDGGGFGVQPKQAIAAAGLDGLRSVSASVRQTEAGMLARFFVAVPEAKRAGLFKLLHFDARDAAPPAFVPADVAEFQRFRLNGQKLWSGLEGLMQQISPQLNSFLMMSINALGKDKDPNFDFRKMFFGNLGDDLVSYQKAPRGKTLPELQNPPSITLVGAVNPDEMLAALRALASLLPGGPDDLTEREVNGKKILSVKMPSPADQPQRKLEIASSGGYVAFASEPGVLEEFLRSADGGGRTLRDLPGLAAAAQEVGGMGSGMFGYQNQRESAAALWEALRNGGLDKLVPAATSKQVGQASSWLDFSVLPPFEQVAKYFGINVSSGTWDAQGFMIRNFTPTPK